MKLLFLGSANGLSSSAANYHSNMLLISDSNKTLLIDCGTDIRFSLTHANYGMEDIDSIYISHLHADHAGGLEWVGLNRKFMSHRPKPVLYIHESLVDPLWEHCLSGGMDTLKTEQATLDSYFDVKAVSSNLKFSWEGIKFELIKTIHMISNGHLMPSYGLIIKYKGRQFFLTTDTQFCKESLKTYYENAEIIFHDCETSPHHSTVHAHFNELKTLSPEIKAKMWLYHFNDNVRPDAIAEGFRGFINPRQEFDLG